MSKVGLSGKLMTALCVVGLVAAMVTPSPAGIWVGSLNTLHLGYNEPAGKTATKKAQIIAQAQTNNCTMLQEVMVTSEVANVTPGGYSYKVSALKGPSTYKEAYGFVYNTTISGSIVNYPESGMDREPSGMRMWTGTNYVWVVNYHAPFDSAEIATEFNLLDNVYNHYKSYTSGMNDVIIGGDFNRVATSTNFNALKGTGCNSILPDVATSINTSGAWANRYDHFCWNPSLTSASSAQRANVDPAYWRTNVSDHGPIRVWVNN